jgi:predicted HicB family RNase H-like nuclease
MSRNSPIKRVIDGKSYNSTTATLIHEKCLSDRDDDPYAHCLQLYRTRFGQFFMVERNEAFKNLAIDDLDYRDSICPLPQEAALKWMEKYCNAKIEQFMEVQEAGDPSTTLTLRMDKTIKIMLNSTAIQAGESMNAWCVRILTNAVSG